MNEQTLEKINKITIDKKVIYVNKSEDEKDGSKDKLHKWEK